MNDTLWTAAEATFATGGRAQGTWTAKGVSIDTRSLVPGDLFIALAGETRDGHLFGKEAFAAGAAAAIVSHIPEGVAPDAALLIVDDTQAALEALGRAARARSRARIVAVTGSAGKTTTKELLRQMLACAGSVSASSSSYNNHWGVPLSLARLPRDADYGVFEIGMNHAGEIRSLVAQVRPHVALITTVAPAHLEYFGSLEAIADAKAEIFERLEPDGTAVVPGDNLQTDRLRRAAVASGVAHLLTFGANTDADARLIESKPDGEGQIVAAVVAGENLRFAIGAVGEHIARNALGALTAVRALGADVRVAVGTLSNFRALGGRGARFDVGRVLVIDESYNANPASVAAALRLLAAETPDGGGRRIAVLGDMLELGAQGPALHRALAADIAAAKTDRVFLCGPQMAALWQELPPARRGAYAATSAELAPQIVADLAPGDVVLVKGSLGSRMATIVAALKAYASAGAVSGGTMARG